MRASLRQAANSVALAAGALLTTIALSHIGLFAVLELKGLDLLFVLRGVEPPPEKVVVVAVDEPSFAELGLQWPWPRSLHGRLVRKLRDAGAVIVGMDILFAEASDPKEDALLAQALRDVGNVVLATGQTVVNDPLFRQTLHADPVPVIRDAAVAVGTPMVLVDADGTVRRTRLGSADTTTFAQSIAREYRSRQGGNLVLDAGLSTRNVGGAQQEVLIDHLGPPRTVATASYYQALDYENALPAGFFAGKAVLVGRSLAIVSEPQQLLGDTFLTPFSWFRLGPTSGVELQATIVANLLEGHAPVEVRGMARVVVLFTLLVAASLTLMRLKPLLGLLTTALMAVLFLALAYIVFIETDTVLPIVAGISGLILVYIGHLMLKTVQAERARRLALEEANRSLGAKVAARTSELSEANRELAQRHADLQAAYQDLARAQEQLIQSEKMASLGLLVAGVAHELNNPISYVANNLDFVEEYVDQLAEANRYQTHEPTGKLQSAQTRSLNRSDTHATLRDLIRSCKEGTERVKKIVLDLRAFSRTDDVGQVPTDLHAGLESTLNLLAKEYQDRIRVHRDYGELPQVECFPGQVNQVFMNLLQNAAQAIPGEGDVWITTRCVRDRVLIIIRDNGVGIPGDDLKRVFDPFFTTKPVGAGTGLGLSISYGILKKHGGRIGVRSEVEGGTEFIIELPIHADGDQVATA